MVVCFAWHPMVARQVDDLDSPTSYHTRWGGCLATLVKAVDKGPPTSRGFHNGSLLELANPL